MLLLKVHPNGNAGTWANTAIQTAVSPYGKFSMGSINAGSGGRISVATSFTIPVIEIIIPEGFSPNRDGINDKYVIIRPYSTRISLEVYNRWGSVVYRSEDYNNEWDGRGNQSTLMGNELADGTYYYIITSLDKQTGKLSKFKGFIVLKR
jgi:gliding motility-associated-like protein